MISPLPGETELLKRSAEGDADAFGPLARHYQGVIYNLALRMLGNAEDAADVTQEVFVNAFRKVRSFEARSSFATWLYAIGVNQARSHQRRQGVRARAGEVTMSSLEPKREEAAYDPPGDGPAPDERMRAQETRRQVERAIAELDHDHRAVVVLRDIEGLDYRAIAEALRWSVGTVKSRLHRARLELRQKLQGLVAG